MSKSSAKSKRLDYSLLAIIAIIVVAGILILSSVSAAFAFKRYGDTYYFLKHQIVFGLLPGLVLGFLAYKIKLSFFKKWSGPFILLALVMMIMVFLPGIGSNSGDAARWIRIGSFSFQPSEALKLAFVIYLAAWLSNRLEKIKQNKEANFWGTFLSFLMVLGVIIVLLFCQSNASTLGVIVAVGIIMYFSTNTPVLHTIITILLGGGGLFLIVKTAPYRVSRWMVFLNPDLDPMGKGYQLQQALIAVGSGGVGGTGFGMSAQKFGFLPQTVSDSIFAVFAEETGFIGAVILVFLFLIFLWRALNAAKESQDNFSRLLALGITSWIIIQTFVNIGAMIGILPLTGIPLPFVSYGGSALIMELIGMGLLLNISKNST